MKFFRAYFLLQVVRLMQYLQMKYPQQGTVIKPIFMSGDFSKGTGKRETILDKAFWRSYTKFARALPYSGFCEITGCKFEAHANYPGGVEQGISEHLNSHGGV